MSENKNQSPEDEDNLLVGNESIIELVEEFYEEFEKNKNLVDLPEIPKKEFGVPESEEDDKKFRLKIKDEIIQRIREIFKESNCFEQQHKKYRNEVIQSAENFTLYKIFGELKRDERRKLVKLNNKDMDTKGFESYDKEVYFDIVKSKYLYSIFLLILRGYFYDGEEESFPSKLVYQLKEYGSYLFKYHLDLDDEEPEYLDSLHELLLDYEYAIELEKKYLNQFGDEEFRELFELGYKKDWVSRN